MACFAAGNCLLLKIVVPGYSAFLSENLPNTQNIFDMVTFQSKPYGQKSALGPLAAQAKKKPFLFFGLPFLTIMVAGSFGLSQLTQTKFDHRDRRHTKVCYQL